MFNAVDPVRKLFKVKHFRTSDIYFLINTRLTPLILLLFSLLMTTVDLTRTSIDCYTDSQVVKSMMDNYCWSVGTYICKDHSMDNILSCYKPLKEEDNKNYQRYYQWISLVLVIQAAISYIPAHLWKMAEGGLLHKLCDSLDTSFGKKNWEEKRNEVVTYFNSQFTSRAHVKYTSQYIACKVLSIALIVLNIVMLNTIIPGFWFTYSNAIAALFAGDSTTWIQYSENVFPKIAKCSYFNYGPSGTRQEYDAQCLLPLNVLNQKIFVLIWLWYSMQLVLSVGNFVYWIIVSYNRNIRMAILRHHSMMSIPRKQIMRATGNGHLGNFFLLHQMAKNTNASTFVELLSELSMSALTSENKDIHGTKSC